MSPKVRFVESVIINGKPKLTGLKVLVIDDSKTIRRTAETLLTKEGCEVFTAVDGFDALSKIADHQPDIVFVIRPARPVPSRPRPAPTRV